MKNLVITAKANTPLLIGCVRSMGGRRPFLSGLLRARSAFREVSRNKPGQNLRSSAAVALCLAGLLPSSLSWAAQPASDGRSASGGFSLTLTVRPTFRILKMTAVPGGHEYQIWTNMKTVQLRDRVYRFERVGEATLTVPGAPIESSEAIK